MASTKKLEQTIQQTKAESEKLLDQARAELKQLNTAKAELQREIVQLEAKAESARENADQADKATAKAVKSAKKAQETLDLLQKSKENGDKILKDQHADIRANEQKLESQNVEIAKNEAFINDAEAHAKEELAKRLETGKKELVELNESIETAKSELQSLGLQRDELVAEIEDKSKDVDKEIADKLKESARLTDAIIKAQETLETLQDQTKEYQLEARTAINLRDKAKEEHENFLSYERRARAELEATDRSLQERMADVVASETLSRNKRSFIQPL